jgi:nitrogen-specific signal transduction histidine kinase
MTPIRTDTKVVGGAIDHGGTVEVERRGFATVFTLCLPLANGTYATPHH